MIAHLIIHTSVRFLAYTWLCSRCLRPRPYCNGECPG